VWTLTTAAALTAKNMGTGAQKVDALFGEQDGIWLHLQGGRSRKSVIVSAFSNAKINQSAYGNPLSQIVSVYPQIQCLP